MMIDPKDIAYCFKKNLMWAHRLDLVSAWATEHDSLCLLEESVAEGLQVRAIVGLWNYITEPNALRRLDQLGELRIAKRKRRFHPKVYLFHGEDQTKAWIGSANFTAGGFKLNEEAVFETDDTKSVTEWFNSLWRGCGRLGEGQIDRYEKEKDQNPLPRQSLAEAGGGVTLPMTLLEQVTSWDNYVAALRDCDIWRSDRNYFSVLGESVSWRHTIEFLHDIIAQNDLVDLNDESRQRLLGLPGGGGWGLLGRMRKNSVGVVFGQNAQDIWDILREVADADEDEFPDLAFECYEEMKGFHGIGKGIATRLLALARPDRFVSLNNLSQHGLAQYSNLARTTLETPNKYQELLEFIYDQNWFNTPEPDNPFLTSIWGMRVALLDCFVYGHGR